MQRQFIIYTSTVELNTVTILPTTHAHIWYCPTMAISIYMYLHCFVLSRELCNGCLSLLHLVQQLSDAGRLRTICLERKVQVQNLLQVMHIIQVQISYNEPIKYNMHNYTCTSRSPVQMFMHCKMYLEYMGMKFASGVGMRFLTRGEHRDASLLLWFWSRTISEWALALTRSKNSRSEVRSWTQRTHAWVPDSCTYTITNLIPVHWIMCELNKHTCSCVWTTHVHMFVHVYTIY